MSIIIILKQEFVLIFAYNWNIPPTLGGLLQWRYGMSHDFNLTYSYVEHINKLSD